VRNTERQLQVNAEFFQIEFGMIAGRPSFSCRSIQNTNIGSRIRATERSIMLGTSLILLELPVITLHKVSLIGRLDEIEEDSRHHIRQHS
jgi:hypothetical protein